MKNMFCKFFVLFGLFFCFSSVTYAKNSLIVLDPASVEILYMLGAEDEILAIPSMKNIEPLDKTSKLDTVGTFTNPSLEKIISLKPKTVIITNYSIGLKDQLERQKIQTMLLPVNKLSDIKKNIMTLGKLTNKTKEAEALSKEFDKKLEQVRNNPIKKSGVFIFSATPLMVFGGDTLPSDVLELIGINNIAKGVSGQRPILSSEFLVSENPDIILYGLRVKDKNELVKANPSFAHLKAIKNGNIYFLELHALLRGSPNIIDEIIRIKQDLSK